MSWHAWFRVVGPSFILGFIVKWIAVAIVAYLLHHFEIASGWWAVGIGTVLGLTVLITGVFRALNKARAQAALDAQLPPAATPPAAPPAPPAQPEAQVHIKPRPTLSPRRFEADPAKP